MRELHDLQEEQSKHEDHNSKEIAKYKRRLLADVFQPKELSFQELETYAMELIKSYGVLSLAAERLNITEIALRKVLASNAELQLIREQSLGGFKGLVDKELIKEIEKGNTDILALVAKMMYSGRDKGALNVNEIGAVADGDEHFAGKDKIQKQGIHVHIHFDDDDAKRASDFVPEDIEDYIDLEPIEEV